MAHYEHLPIYKKAMDFAIYIETIVRHFSRYHKYSLGSDLRHLARQTVRLVIRANSQRDQSQRINTLCQLRVTIEEVKICLRLGKEVKAFQNLNSFVQGIEQVVGLSKQNEGWLKKMQQMQTARTMTT